MPLNAGSDSRSPAAMANQSRPIRRRKWNPSASGRARPLPKRLISPVSIPFRTSGPITSEHMFIRPIWKQSVGIPASSEAAGDARTYSLMTNRFADHTSLYVRVEDEHRSVVYATYSLGHVISFDEPHAEIDRENRLHVLHCSAPRAWSYAIIGLNGQLL